MPGAPPVTSAPPPRAAAIPTAVAPAAVVSNASTAPAGIPNLSTPNLSMAAEPNASPIDPVARGRRPLRKLSPEEKAQRRLRRNIVMAAMCLAILLIAMSLLIKIGG